MTSSREPDTGDTTTSASTIEDSPSHHDQESQDISQDATLPASPEVIAGTQPLEGAAPKPPLRLGPPPFDEENLTDEHPGRYQHAGELGAGGIGKVTIALDQHLGRQVAIKELHPRHTLGEANRGSGSGGSGSGRPDRSPAERRFLNEARITSNLEHPGIVPIHELGKRADDTIYYTMKLVRGRTLAESLKGQDLAGRLRLLPSFLGLCHAVGYAHSRSVIHRDLKPENVMLGDHGETVVLDWGLAKYKGERDLQDGPPSEALDRIGEATPDVTVAGAPLGTPTYMSPEQARGDLKGIDERSDVYSLGVILYYILTRSTPFSGTSVELIAQTLASPVKQPSELEPAAPFELSAIAMRALSKDPKERYPDAEALAEDVLAFQMGGLVGAHSYSWWSLAARWARRHKRIIAAALVALCLAAGAWWYRGHSDKQELATAERARQARVLAEVERILAKVERGNTQSDWLNLYTYRLIALKEPLVEARLIRALQRPEEGVSRLSARALGGMKSSAAVLPLTRRLGRGMETSDAVVIDVINALGVIEDPRAQASVAAARWRYGQWGYVWRNTELAYKMIPMPPLGRRKLTAEQWRRRGRARWFKEDRQGALEDYGRGLAVDPRHVATLNSRGVSHKVMGSYRAALRDYNAALAIDPEATAPMINRGVIRHLVGEYRGAREDFDRALAKAPRDLFAWRFRALLRHTVGDVAGARADFQRAIQIEPDNPSNFFFQGTFMHEQELWTEALGSFAQALALSSTFVEALVARAEIHQADRRMSEALTELDRALSLAPGDARTRAVRGRIRMLSGDRAAAKRELDACVQARPADGVRWAYRAIFYHAQVGALDEARRDLDKGIQRADLLSRPLLRICALAIAARRGEVGRRDAQLVALSTEDEPRRFERQVILWLRGKLPAAAIPKLQQEAARLPVHRCLYGLAAGTRAAMDGRPDEARTHYQKARQKAAPNHLACVTAQWLARGQGGGTPSE